MLIDERRHLIAEAVLAQGAATVAKLSERFGVSQVTIRSDLEALETQGMLKRNRGGAVANRVSRYTPAFQQQSSVQPGAKRAIAAAAAERIEDGDWILLDAGSTTLYLAGHLMHRRLTVAANSVYSLNKLVEAPEIELIVIGGMLHRPALSFAGDPAETFLERMHFDKAFIGVNGVTRRGISVNNPVEAGIKRRMIEAASEVIVLAHAAKLGVDSLVRFAPLDAVDLLITDRGASRAVRAQLTKDSSLEVIVA